MTCGIYAIKNLVNGKVYVGQSVNIERRFGVHKAKLRHNNHWNNHLQTAWLKYSEDMFSFEVLTQCEETKLDSIEIEWITDLKSRDRMFGYNRTEGGEGGKQNEDVRELMSKKAIGRPGYWTGKTIPEEARKKMSEAAKKRSANKHSKPVICVETRVEYKSCAEAARIVFTEEHQIKAAGYINRIASGKRKYPYLGYTWKFKELQHGTSV